MLFIPSNLNSNLALTLGYLNPALNNPAQAKSGTKFRLSKDATTSYMYTT